MTPSRSGRDRRGYPDTWSSHVTRSPCCERFHEVQPAAAWSRLDERDGHLRDRCVHLVTDDKQSQWFRCSINPPWSSRWSQRLDNNGPEPAFPGCRTRAPRRSWCPTLPAYASASRDRPPPQPGPVPSPDRRRRCPGASAWSPPPWWRSRRLLLVLFGRGGAARRSGDHRLTMGVTTSLFFGVYGARARLLRLAAVPAPVVGAGAGRAGAADPAGRRLELPGGRHDARRRCC